jgi:AraC family transcriptional regulator of adaptative response / DNA-3-methyladenine glycosylase II
MLQDMPQSKNSSARPTTNAQVLQLPFRPPYDFEAVLAFLAPRAFAGLEYVDETGYERTFGTSLQPGWLRVTRDPIMPNTLRAELHGLSSVDMADAERRLRTIFDLDADPRAIGRGLARDPLLAPLVKQRPDTRVPGSWNGFEVAVRTVLGQQVSVKAARTFAARLVEAHGIPLAVPHPSGLHRLFPSPETLATAPLRGIGLAGARAASLNSMAQAVADGRVSFDPGQSLEVFLASWIALPGIGDWTAQYLAMRALHHPDAFPAGDWCCGRQHRKAWTHS